MISAYTPAIAMLVFFHVQTLRRAPVYDHLPNCLRCPIQNVTAVAAYMEVHGRMHSRDCPPRCILSAPMSTNTCNRHGPVHIRAHGRRRSRRRRVESLEPSGPHVLALSCRFSSQLFRWDERSTGAVEAVLIVYAEPKSLPRSGSSLGKPWRRSLNPFKVVNARFTRDDSSLAYMRGGFQACMRVLEAETFVIPTCNSI